MQRPEVLLSKVKHYKMHKHRYKDNREHHCLSALAHSEQFHCNLLNYELRASPSSLLASKLRVAWGCHRQLVLEASVQGNM
eukprot:4415140-Amphidinium_carterae.3